MSVSSRIVQVSASAPGSVTASAQAPPAPKETKSASSTGSVYVDETEPDAPPVVAHGRGEIRVNDPSIGFSTITATAEATGGGVASGYAKKGIYYVSQSPAPLTFTITDLTLRPNAAPDPAERQLGPGRFELRITGLLPCEFDPRIVRPGDGLDVADLAMGPRPARPVVPPDEMLFSVTTVTQPTVDSRLLVETHGSAVPVSTLTVEDFVGTEDGGHRLRSPKEMTFLIDQPAGDRTIAIEMIVTSGRRREAPDRPDRGTS